MHDLTGNDDDQIILRHRAREFTLYLSRFGKSTLFETYAPLLSLPTFSALPSPYSSLIDSRADGYGRWQ